MALATALALATSSAARAALKVVSWTVASLGAVAPWNRMSPDGFSWDSSESWTRDGRGSWIGVVIDNTGPAARFAFSNDGGLTFSVSGTIDGAGLFTRASIVVDRVNDWVYALWQCTANTDGVLLRKYAITRTVPGDMTSAIASISTARDASLNLQLDFFSTTGIVVYGSPQLFMLYDNPAWSSGGLLAIWSIGQTGSTVNGGEVRAAFRALSNSAADNTPANWTAPMGAGAKTITQGPNATLPFSKLHASTATVSNISGNNDPFCSAVRLANAGVYASAMAVSYFDTSIDAFERTVFQWRGSPSYDFAGGAVATTLLAHRGGVTDSDTGYNGKQEIVSQGSHDPVGDRYYIGLPQWTGDGVGGDRWVLVEVDHGNANAVATAVVYQSAKADNATAVFVTGSAYFDPVAGAVLTTYTDLDPKNAYGRTYNRTTPAAAAVAIDTSQPWDIPCILPWRDANGRAVVVGRSFNAAAASTATPPTPTYTPPYQGYICRGTWS